MGGAQCQISALTAQMDTLDASKAESYQACTCRSFTAHVKAALAHVEDTHLPDAAARQAETTCRFFHKVTSAVTETR